MLARSHVAPTTTSLIIVENGAAVPLATANYRGTQDTAVVAQQPGESANGLTQRIRRALRANGPSRALLETVVLVVTRNTHSPVHERQSLALALSELLAPGGSLVLVADRAGAALQQELLALAGALIEEGHVEHSVAVHFDARDLAELAVARAPLVSRPASTGMTWSTAC